MGNFHYIPDFSNTCYHLDFAHIECKSPIFDGQVFILFVEFQSLDVLQCSIVENCNWHLNYVSLKRFSVM